MPDGALISPNTVEVLQPWEFPIEVMDVGAINTEFFGPEAPSIIADEYQAIVRTDTNTVLGIHKQRYKPLEYTRIYESVLDAVNKSGVSKDFTINVNVLEGGKKIRIQILFEDIYIEDPEVGDYIKFKIDVVSSLDGAWPFLLTALGLRLWCKNGCTTPDPVCYTKYKHTHLIDVEAHAAKISTALEAFYNHKDIWMEWRKVPVSHETAENFFKKTLAKAQTNTTEFKHNKVQLEALMGLWRKETQILGTTKWALFNACTYWQDHTEGDAAHNTRFRREAEMRKTLKSKHWEAICTT